MHLERNPDPPLFNKEACQLITRLCFRKDDQPQKVDGIFVYASAIGLKDLSDLIKKLLLQGFSDQLFLTGGITPQPLSKELEIKDKQCEADLILNKLGPKETKGVKVFVERKSSNTLENVTETLKNPAFKKCRNLIFIFKAHASGRGYLTLRKFFPQTKILQQSFAVTYPRASQPIKRETWSTFDFGRRRVWGEFLRIRKYGAKGDIAHQEVKNLIKKIELEINNSN